MARALAGFVPIRQNRVAWNRKSREGCAKPTNTSSSKYKLKPTPDQERRLEEVLWRCRVLYNSALEQRITAYRRCGVTLTAYQQQAEVPDLRAAFPEYAAIHSQVLQDVLTRLDQT